MERPLVVGARGLPLLIDPSSFMLPQLQQPQLFPSSASPHSPTLPLAVQTPSNGSGAASATLRSGVSLNEPGSATMGSPALGPLLSPSTADDARRPSNYLDQVKSWDDDQVAQWLDEVNAGQHASVFKANDITGAVLLDVDQAALKEMGLKSVGDRVKLVVAIRALRQRCITAARLERQSTGGAREPLVSASAVAVTPPAVLERSGSPTVIGSSVENSNILSNSSLQRKFSSARSQGRIPPPLHLSQSNTINPTTEAWQPPSTTSAVSSRAGNTSAPMSSRPTPGVNRSAPPPLLPPPRSQPPLAPAPLSRTHSGTPPPLLRSTTPSISTTSASPPKSITNSSTLNQPWSGDYGLPRAPSPGNLVGGVFTRVLPAPVPNGSSRIPSYDGQHRRTPSLNPVIVSAPYGHNQPLSTHPYATPTSPPSDTPRPDSTSARVLLPSATIGGNPLSPVYEAGRTSTPIESGHRSPGGRGPYSTPPLASGLSTSTSLTSLEAVLRKAVKFIGEDGVSKMVAVADCVDGREVLIRVLRKFQKAGVGSERDEAEHWGLFRTADDHARPLGEMDILTICRDAQAPERLRGLVFRRLNSTILDSSTQRKRDRKLQWMFGEDHTPDTTLPGGVASRAPTSPNYLGIEIPSTSIEPASPASSSITGSYFDHDDGRASLGSSTSAPLRLEREAKPNRASTVSIMSGLGGTEWSSPDSSTGVRPTSRSPSAGFLGSGRKLRSFFGQRPPSELIATHLTEYFPKAEKNLLSKQVRESMRRSIVRRDSQYSVMGTSWEKAPDRLSLTPATSYVLSLGHNNGSFENVGGAGDGPVLRQAASTRSLNGSVTSSSSHLEPPDESAEDDDFPPLDRRTSTTHSIKASRRMSRLAGVSRGVSSVGWDVKTRDSDSSSVLTVDEVTAELETRRASMAEYTSGEDEVEALNMRPPSVAISSDDVEDDYSDDEDMDDEDDEEQELEESAANPLQTDIASIRSKPATKWIKGALIGAGSFGSVYLGMNPMNGSLMAVKQVELPTGTSHNEERKKSMLDALEREIELLKVLRHENIVQYLDSSSDATHLNIFLEYVPGGSVAALLSNYGAFEEALVSKFVRQILTGLEYLHEREIIHRDIKGANILVDNKGGIKISDFGISKKVEDNLLAGAHRPSLQGSVFWMAPEVVKQTAYTSKADIWSLGCLVVEMLTGAHPWANLTQMQAIFRIGSSSRPAIPEDISVDAADFLDSAFLIDHSKRPSASALLRHPFVRDLDARPTSQQTPTRATFSDSHSSISAVA